MYVAQLRSNVYIGGALYQFGMAVKYNSLMAIMFGFMCAGMAGLNYYLL